MMDYLNLCVDIVVPVKTERCFAHNNPCVGSNVKDLLNNNNKKKAFQDRNIKRGVRDVRRAATGR